MTTSLIIKIVFLAIISIAVIFYKYHQNKKETKMSYTYEYPRPMVTTDIILFTSHSCEAEILLIKRLNDPFKNQWALPGGFVDENESLESAAKRELLEETGLEIKYLKQFYSFGDYGRDPRGHCISIVYFDFINKTEAKIKAGDDAKEVRWFKINKLPPLAFDHKVIIEKAISKLIQ